MVLTGWSFGADVALSVAVPRLAAWMAIVMLSLAIAWLLDQGINRALAFALVGVVWAVGGLLLYLAARKRVERIEGLPETRESIKEDVQWAKAQKS